MAIRSTNRLPNAGTLSFAKCSADAGSITGPRLSISDANRSAKRFALVFPDAQPIVFSKRFAIETAFLQSNFTADCWAECIPISFSFAPAISTAVKLAIAAADASAHLVAVVGAVCRTDKDTDSFAVGELCS